MVAGRFWLIAGALLAGLAVAAGAFGAHALRSRLNPADLVTFETAVRYQMYHALGLLAVAGLTSRGYAAEPSGWLFLVGILLFSGSLYLLTLGGLRWMGAITPLGGLAFIVGWVWMAVNGWRVSAP